MALGLLAEVMGWTSETDAVPAHEYAWLRLMSSIKYDGYADFRAGVRFLESLAVWLKQFDVADRPAAYQFVKQRLVYISLSEMLRLIENFVPEVVTPILREVVATELDCKPYEVWATPEGAKSFNKHLRQTLFVGLSDGSRSDVLRRANSGRLSPEQIVPMLNIDGGKWRDLADKLAKEHAGARFERVFLIDDFTASGTTFIREVDGEWKGKLNTFNKMVIAAQQELGDDFPIPKGYHLHIHHYVSSDQARLALEERTKDAQQRWAQAWFGEVEITEGLRLPPDLKLTQPRDAAMLDLGDRYYDHALYERIKKHCDENGQSDMKLGYANCALPIVLDHNTPNNSIPLLWAETPGANGTHPMRPLFHRRDRHG